MQDNIIITFYIHELVHLAHLRSDVSVCSILLDIIMYLLAFQFFRRYKGTSNLILWKIFTMTSFVSLLFLRKNHHVVPASISNEAFDYNFRRT